MKTLNSSDGGYRPAKPFGFVSNMPYRKITYNVSIPVIDYRQYADRLNRAWFFYSTTGDFPLHYPSLAFIAGRSLGKTQFLPRRPVIDPITFYRGLLRE